MTFPVGVAVGVAVLAMRTTSPVEVTRATRTHGVPDLHDVVLLGAAARAPTELVVA